MKIQGPIQSKARVKKSRYEIIRCLYIDYWAILKDFCWERWVFVYWWEELLLRIKSFERSLIKRTKKTHWCAHLLEGKWHLCFQMDCAHYSNYCGSTGKNLFENKVDKNLPSINHVVTEIEWIDCCLLKRLTRKINYASLINTFNLQLTI